MTDLEALKSSLKEEILNELKTMEKPKKKAKKSEPIQSVGEKSEPLKTESTEPKQKRKCTEKQLAALAAGRQKNPRWIAKRMREEQAKAEEQGYARTQSSAELKKTQ